MYSIGDMVDKLIIETVKTFDTRQKLRSEELSDEAYVELNNKMMVFHNNTTKLFDFYFTISTHLENSVN